jgi:hypothetical protein
MWELPAAAGWFLNRVVAEFQDWAAVWSAHRIRLRRKRKGTLNS